MRTQTISCCLVVFLFVVVSPAQNTGEKLLSVENAYDPIPSPDDKLIAYVRTGWGRGATSGFGRSHLRSEIAVMTASGELFSPTPVADAFLSGWTLENQLICYRDWHFLLISLDRGVLQKADETGGDGRFERSERVAYLSKTKTFVWVEHRRTPRTILLTQNGPIGESSATTGAMVVPSPDQRFIAVVGNGRDLWIYDITQKTWTNLGTADIHPDRDWDYIKPSWNPWFADSSRLAFFSGSSLVIASPDGRHRSAVNIGNSAGLAVPSPDGKRIAFVSFSARPSKNRSDLKFWGSSAVWVIASDGKGQPLQVTARSEDTTYDLNWAGSHSLVFDRISDTGLYSHARLWSVTVPQ